MHALAFATFVKRALVQRMCRLPKAEDTETMLLDKFPPRVGVHLDKVWARVEIMRKSA